MNNELSSEVPIIHGDGEEVRDVKAVQVAMVSVKEVVPVVVKIIDVHTIDVGMVPVTLSLLISIKVLD